MLTPQQHTQLTGQVECYLHTHPRQPLDQTSQAELEAASPVLVITAATYSLAGADEHISIGQTCTVTLPLALKGKEYHITLTADVTVTIVPSGTDTIMGTTSMIATVQWTSLHLKATTTGNWILI